MCILEVFSMNPQVEEEIPEFFYEHIEQARQGLKDAKESFGKDVVGPEEFVQ